MPKDLESPLIVRRRDLYEAVVLQTGVRNGEVRLVMEATLDCIHKALLQNAEVHIPPLGQIKPITRETEAGARTIYKLNLTKDQKAEQSLIQGLKDLETRASNRRKGD